MGSYEDYYQFSEHLQIKDGYMYCENVKIKSIQDTLLEAEEMDHPSPFYLYSKQQLLDNVSAYKSPLDKWNLNYLLGYAVKANHNPWILKTILDQGCTAVTVNGHETQLAIKMGMSPSKIVVNGNGKMTWEIEVAVANECLINVDSEFDLRHISEVANRLKKTTKVLLRLNPDIDSKVHPYLATGLAASKFGLEESQLDDLLAAISRDKYLELVGLHCHIGSTIDDAHVFSECLDVMMEKADSVKKRGFSSLRYLNLGGGLGIDYNKHAWRTKENPDPQLTQALFPSPGDLIDKVKDKLQARPDICLILEPGRSLIGSAVTLVTKVVGCKENKDTKYIVVDGSMTEVIRPSLYGAYLHMELTEPSCSSGRGREKFDIVGPVCECADFLGKDRWLTEPHEGCGLAVLDAGAYCASMSSNYNLRMRPAEILVDGSGWRMIREPDRIEDLMNMYKY